MKIGNLIFVQAEVNNESVSKTIESVEGSQSPAASVKEPVESTSTKSEDTNNSSSPKTEETQKPDVVAVSSTD